jgi:hypothetical protein
VDWITDYIAIGGFSDVEEAKSRVDAILCLKDDCCDEGCTETEILCLPLVDGAGNDIKLLDAAVDFIDDVISRRDTILVHCHAGRSRSVCVVARYFMIKHGLTSHQALNKIKSKRETYLSTGIEEILSVNLN